MNTQQIPQQSIYVKAPTHIYKEDRHQDDTLNPDL
jgi:hypothetical protein